MTDKKKEDGKPKGPVRLKIKVDEAVAKGVYSNTAMVHNNESEFVLDFVFAEPHGAAGHVVSRVITNPKAAKRLHLGLDQLIRRYEERFGEIELPKANFIDPETVH